MHRLDLAEGECMLVVFLIFSFFILRVPSRVPSVTDRTFLFGALEFLALDFGH